MALHSIWHSSAPPWEPAEQTDGTPSIRTAAGFYGVSTDLEVVGGALRVPAGTTLPSTVTLALRTSAVGSLPDLGAAPLASGTANVPGGGGWATASWAAQTVAAGTEAWISVEDAGAIYQFVSSGTVGLGPTQATDASDLWWAERNSVGVEVASAFRIGSGSTEASTAWYGLDIIVTDGSAQYPVEGVAAAVSGALGTIGAALAVSGSVSATSTTVGAVTAGLAVAGTVAGTSTTFGTVTIVGEPGIPELTVGSPTPNPFAAAGPQGHAFAVGAPRRATP